MFYLTDESNINLNTITYFTKNISILREYHDIKCYLYLILFSSICQMHRNKILIFLLERKKKTEKREMTIY